MPHDGFALDDGAIVRSAVGIDVSSFGSVLRSRIARIVRTSETGASSIVRELEATCSIPETYFFRHPDQWRHFERLARTLPAVAEGRRVRAWSAGTATGEEAYSLALALRRATGTPPEVLGTDMNREALERAGAATYGPWSLRGVDPSMYDELFETGHAEFVVREDLRACVRFEPGNLVLDELPSDLDVIFCRNVFLYFDPGVAKSVLRRMRESLRPGGLLVLGPYDPAASTAEAMFEPVARTAGIYRRREPSLGMPHASPSPSHARGSERPTRTSTRPSPRSPDVATDTAPSGSDREPASTILRLVHENRADEAIRLYETLRHESVLSPDLHLAATFAFWELDRPDDGLFAARAAYFLDPSRASSRAVFGLGLARVDHRARALPLLRDALGSLDETSPLAGLDPADLRLLVEAELQRADAD